MAMRYHKLKIALGIKKFARIRSLLETLNLEMRLKKSSMCWDILTFLRGNYKDFDHLKAPQSTSFCKQLNSAEKKTHFDVTHYSSKTSIELINHLFMDTNRGLVDSLNKFLIIILKYTVHLVNRVLPIASLLEY
ncbi:hypothetical protein BpHYR1_019180 [Brachionus plicatilis]|uniref:RNA-directed DNA polymerase from mobile element jockey-like n=1 Tax=Brachionus plicatilis TaxID=10195 RepID=A0A3M7QQY1_BRAPC|nr:hypothetical protein BpHYR1_019180 [Brachionus plicatilis]